MPYEDPYLFTDTGTYRITLVHTPTGMTTSIPSFTFEDPAFINPAGRDIAFQALVDSLSDAGIWEITAWKVCGAESAVTPTPIS